ncbi:quinol-cytochrome oxidoreductase complex cytochrome b subunit [Streptomyces sp. B3I8]|nr:quinol-cytochrome oxidoreductase complex cytochrome b subunit [Streptomyces sp. B3I8]
MFGFLLLVLAMFGGLTGYDLPDDLLSGTGPQVVNGTILPIPIPIPIPIVGTYVSFFLFGGEFPGEDLVARFDTLHILIVPALVIASLVGHLTLAVRHRHAQYPGPGRTRTNVVGDPVPGVRRQGRRLRAPPGGPAEPTS